MSYKKLLYKQLQNYLIMTGALSLQTSSLRLKIEKKNICVGTDPLYNKEALGSRAQYQPSASPLHTDIFRSAFSPAKQTLSALHALRWLGARHNNALSVSVFITSAWAREYHKAERASE